MNANSKLNGSSKSNEDSTSKNKMTESDVHNLMEVYPEFYWKAFMFDRVPLNYWDDFGNHILYFNYLSNELNIKSLDDWYEVSLSDLRKQQKFKNISSVLKYYGDSLINALLEIYPSSPLDPSFQWKIFKFKQVPKHYWNDSNNLLSFISYAAKELYIKNYEDWYNISSEQIRKMGGFTPLIKNGGLISLLSKVYPEYSWVS